MYRIDWRLTLLFQDVDTIYLSQDSRELNLQDFDHLNPKLVHTYRQS
jgi:hypothetical protein